MTNLVILATCVVTSMVQHMKIPAESGYIWKAHCMTNYVLGTPQGIPLMSLQQYIFMGKLHINIDGPDWKPETNHTDGENYTHQWSFEVKE